MRSMLLARGLTGIWFTSRILAALSPEWTGTFDLLADYLVADGIGGLVVATLLLREGVISAASRERWLSIVVLVDGLGRFVSGIAVHVWPGIPGFPVTAVLFVGVMAISTLAVGVSEAALFIEEETARHGRRHGRPELPAVPLGIAAIAAIAFAVGLVRTLSDPDWLRWLVAAYVASASAVMFGMAWSRRPRSRSRRTA